MDDWPRRMPSYVAFLTHLDFFGISLGNVLLCEDGRESAARGAPCTDTVCTLLTYQLRCYAFFALSERLLTVCREVKRNEFCRAHSRYCVNFPASFNKKFGANDCCNGCHPKMRCDGSRVPRRKNAPREREHKREVKRGSLH